MKTPEPIPPDFLHRLFTPLCHDFSCGLCVLEIQRDDPGNQPQFVGKVANQLFCQLFSIHEHDILEKPLPESLCQTLELPSLLEELQNSEATQTQRDILLNPDRSCTVQAHLPCAELLTIAIRNSKPEQAEINSHAETILASLGDPCVIIDRNFTILYENDAAQALWGSNLGKKCHTLYHGLPNRCESCHSAAVFTDGMIHKNERLFHLNGSERHLEITSAPLKDAAGMVTAVVNIIHDITVRKMTEKGKEHLIRELQASLAKTKRLNGLLPICSYCKKIKDDNGVWQQIESYLRSRAEVEFSHGICQECEGKRHPQASNTLKK